MNSAEVCAIKKTWEIPIATPTDSGAAILIRFFTKYPSNLEKFPFKDTPVEELNKSPRFRAHAGRIIRVFDESIQTLGHDNCVDKLQEIWGEIAVTHFKRQISRQSYNELRGVILEVLSEVCKLDDAQTAAWCKMTDIVYDIIFKKVAELEAQ